MCQKRETLAKGRKLGGPAAVVSSEKIRQLLASGKSMARIAEALGVSSATILPARKTGSRTTSGG
jgi:hypothetical protein